MQGMPALALLSSLFPDARVWLLFPGSRLQFLLNQQSRDCKGVPNLSSNLGRAWSQIQITVWHLLAGCGLLVQLKLQSRDSKEVPHSGDKREGEAWVRNSKLCTAAPHWHTAFLGLHLCGLNQLLVYISVLLFMFSHWPLWTIYWKSSQWWK